MSNLTADRTYYAAALQYVARGPLPKNSAPAQAVAPQSVPVPLFGDNHRAQDLDPRLVRIVDRFLPHVSANVGPSWEGVVKFTQDDPLKIIQLLQQVVETMQSSPNCPLNHLDQQKDAADLDSDSPLNDRYNRDSQRPVRAEMAKLVNSFLKLVHTSSAGNENITPANLGKDGPGALFSHIENTLEKASQKYLKSACDSEFYIVLAEVITMIIVMPSLAFPLCFLTPLGIYALFIAMAVGSVCALAASLKTSHTLYQRNHPRIQQLFEEATYLRVQIDLHLGNNPLRIPLLNLLDDVSQLDGNETSWTQTLFNGKHNTVFGPHHVKAGLKTDLAAFLMEQFKSQNHAQDKSVTAPLLQD